MLTIRRAKSFQGKTTLPPSPDLFLLTQFAAMAAGRSVVISPVGDAPALRNWAALLEGHAAITWGEKECRIEPIHGGAEEIIFASPQIPYRDLVVSLALGARKRVVFNTVSRERLDSWADSAQRIGCALEVEHEGVGGSVRLADSCRAPAVPGPIDERDISLLLGLAVGLRARLSFASGVTLSTPLRGLIELFGGAISVKRDVERENDPLVRRMRLAARQRLSSQDQLFTIAVDCSFSEAGEPAAIALPGDEVLLSLLLLAKSLIVKGSLVIDNAPLEGWALPVLGLMRKMGCKPMQQPAGKGGAFGETGMVSCQKYDLSGQKISCVPAIHYAAQLPTMAFLAAFAQGQSILRGLQDLRIDVPDPLRQIEACLSAMRVSLGNLPDGVVIKGSGEHDGFDCIEPLSASLAGACVVAGLHCMGKTTVNDELIVERWPSFHRLLEELVEYR